MLKKDLLSPLYWKYESLEATGFHGVVSPDNSACKVVWIFRLNLNAGQSYLLIHKSLEMSAVLVNGTVNVKHQTVTAALNRLDSFYLPASEMVTVTAVEKAFLFIGGAPYEGIGDFFIRKGDLSLPMGDIHQIHGEKPYEREVFMTLDPHTPASRLITGLTWSHQGAWTSWPPHQHEKHLEEVYCYFDLPKPKFGLHLSYRHAGQPEAVHIVSTGDCVIAPRGYHPTVAIPGMKNTYFWVLAAHSIESRRYDLAVKDEYYME